MSSVSTHYLPSVDTRYIEMRTDRDIDYSIHFLEPLNLLIAHMRYIGNDFEVDMAEIGKSEHTKKWWKVSPVSELLRPTLQSGFSPNIHSLRRRVLYEIALTEAHGSVNRASIRC